MAAKWTSLVKKGEAIPGPPDTEEIENTNKKVSHRNQDTPQDQIFKCFMAATLDLTHKVETLEDVSMLNPFDKKSD